MSYTVVEKATMGQAACIISGSIEGPFVDTGTVCHVFEPYGYIAVDVFIDVARKALGMATVDEIETERAKNAALAGQVQDLEAQLAEAEDAIRAIDVIESKDFRARKKPGRRKTVEV